MDRVCNGCGFRVFFEGDTGVEVPPNWTRIVYQVQRQRPEEISDGHFLFCELCGGPDPTVHGKVLGRLHTYFWRWT